MSEQLGLVFLTLFVLAAAACIFLSVTMARRVQIGINQWCNEERQALETQLRELANADARTQIERWKQQHEQEIRLDAVQRSSAVTTQCFGGAPEGSASVRTRWMKVRCYSELSFGGVKVCRRSDWRPDTLSYLMSGTPPQAQWRSLRQTRCQQIHRSRL